MVRHSLLAIPMIFLLMSSTAFAGKADKRTSPYAACKGIEITTVSKDAPELQKVCDTCRVQAAPEITALSGNLTGTQFYTIAMDFLSQVAERTRDTMKKNVAHYKELRSCLEAEKPGCPEKISKFMTDLRAAHKERDIHHFATQRLQSLNTYSYATDPKAAQHAIYSEGFAHSKNVTKEDMSALEAEARAVINKAKGSCDADKITLPSMCAKRVEEAIKALNRKHHEDYLDVTFGKMPVLAHLQSVKWDKWYDMATLKTAMTKIIEAGEKQIAITQKSIDKGNLEFTTIGKDRDLVDYMAFTPIVEQILKERPGFCGIATSLNERLGNRKTAGVAVGMVGALALAAGGGFVAGAATAGAITGTEAMNLAGLAMGLTWANAFNDYVSTKEATVAGVQDAKEIEERAKLLGWETLAFPANFFGTGPLFKLFGAKTAKSFLTVAEKVKTNPQSLTKLESALAKFIKSAKNERDATLLARSSEQNKKILQQIFREEGYGKDNSAKITECVMSGGSASACKNIGKLLAELDGMESGGAVASRGVTTSGTSTKVATSTTPEDLFKVNTSQKPARVQAIAELGDGMAAKYASVSDWELSSAKIPERWRPALSGAKRSDPVLNQLVGALAERKLAQGAGPIRVITASGKTLDIQGPIDIKALKEPITQVKFSADEIGRFTAAEKAIGRQLKPLDRFGLLLAHYSEGPGKIHAKARFLYPLFGREGSDQIMARNIAGPRVVEDEYTAYRRKYINDLNAKQGRPSRIENPSYEGYIKRNDGPKNKGPTPSSDGF